MVSPQKTYRVSVIIVHYKTPDETRHLLELLKSDELEIIVIDHSPDNTFKTVCDDLFPQVRYIFRNGNFGYADGVNTGVTLATASWMMILNSDITMNAAQILQLCENAETHKYTVAAPQIISNSGSENQAGYFDSFFSHPINALFMRPHAINTMRNNKVRIEVDYVIGAALLVHQSVWSEIGMFDAAHFFMYFEDVDFCYRLKQKGIAICIDCSIRVHHLGGASSKNIIEKMNMYRTSRYNYLCKYRGATIAQINEFIHILN